MKFDPNWPRLAFAKPVFRQGRMQMTVRLGTKWFFRVHAEGHKTAVVLGPDSRPLGIAQLVDAWSGPLSMALEGVHLFNHDPACRSAAGVLAELERVYGKECSPDTQVTFLFFQV